MKLSTHFTLEEFTESDYATRHGIENSPPAEILDRLISTANQLDRVRDLLGHPVLISSGYRCPELNAGIGGSKTSAHMDGWAVDFTCPGFGTPLEICHRLSGELPYDQIIHEYGRWVHISFSPKMREENLTKCKGEPYAPGFKACK